ncbi:hypothetical protein RP20_CCG012777 [Aedes albopictus]|nr:hypothetical protein RP20_CCG012777 [Aedes albopictus]
MARTADQCFARKRVEFLVELAGLNNGYFQSIGIGRFAIAVKVTKQSSSVMRTPIRWFFPRFSRVLRNGGVYDGTTSASLQ